MAQRRVDLGAQSDSLQRLDDAQEVARDNGVPDAHGSDRHNTNTTLLEHYVRVGTGELPEGGVLRRPPQSGRAVNHDDYADAVERAIAVNAGLVAAGEPPLRNIYVGFTDPDVVAGQVVAKNGSSFEQMGWFRVVFSQRGPWVTTFFVPSVPSDLVGSNAELFLR